MILQAEWENYLGLAAGTDVTLLTTIELQSVALFESLTNRYFGATAAITETYIGNGTCDLWLREKPQSELAADVDVTEQAYPGATTNAIVDTDTDGFVLRVHARNIAKLVRKGGSVWTRGYEYLVTYDRGYAASAEPADVREAVLDIMAMKYADAKAQATAPTIGIGGLTGEKLGDYSYTLGVVTTTPGTTPGLSNRVARVQATVNNWKHVW